MLASPPTVTGPRTQSRLSSATVWLLTLRFVVIRKEKKNCRWGLLLEPGAGVWEHDWSRGLDLGERAREREQGVPLEPGGLGLRLGLGRPAL